MKLTDIRHHERLAARFWAKVDKGPHPYGCWLWTGSVDGSGYGAIGVAEPRGYRPLKASRIAYLLAHGEVCDDLDVCHSCDIYYESEPKAYRRCVNPAHLWQGTRKENLADMTAKGRRVVTPSPQPGERNGQAKLTAQQVRDIRQRYAGGEKQNALAREYGLSAQTINNIVLRQTWKHLDEGSPILAPYAGNRTLSDNQVREIRVLYAQGYRQRRLAQQFGVGPTAIHHIVHRETWRHLEE